MRRQVGRCGPKEGEEEEKKKNNFDDDDSHSLGSGRQCRDTSELMGTTACARQGNRMESMRVTMGEPGESAMRGDSTRLDSTRLVSALPSGMRAKTPNAIGPERTPPPINPRGNSVDLQPTQIRSERHTRPPLCLSAPAAPRDLAEHPILR